jgi:hypothetical protein
MEQSTHQFYATEGHLNTTHAKEQHGSGIIIFSTFGVMVISDELLDNNKLTSTCNGSQLVWLLCRLVWILTDR